MVGRRRVTIGIAVLVVGAAQADRVVPTDRVENRVSVFAAADSDSDVVAALRVGESLPFVRAVPRWNEVTLSNGSNGFVNKSWTRVVPDGPATASQNDLRIHYLNVGAGTCTVVECPGPNNPPPMIVDCGSLQSSANDMDNEDARTYIEGVLQTRRPNVVISHADRDHYGWIPHVLQNVRVQNVWQGGNPDEYEADGFKTWLAGEVSNGATARANFDQHFSNNGDAITVGPTCGTASVFVLTANSGESKNAQSLVLHIAHGDFSATFTGDAEGVTEAQAIANFDSNVKTTVLSGSHHGARTFASNSPAWAAATAPEIVIFSAGRKFGHPQCDAVGRFTSSLARTLPHPTQCGRSSRYDPVSATDLAVFMTELSGAIVITSSGTSPLSLRCSATNACNVQIAH